jgi:hypothetical protein
MIAPEQRSTSPKASLRHSGDPANPMAAGQLAHDRSDNAPLAGAVVRRKHLNIGKPVNHVLSIQAATNRLRRPSEAKGWSGRTRAIKDSRAQRTDERLTLIGIDKPSFYTLYVLLSNLF